MALVRPLLGPGRSARTPRCLLPEPLPADGPVPLNSNQLLCMPWHPAQLPKECKLSRDCSLHLGEACIVPKERTRQVLGLRVSALQSSPERPSGQASRPGPSHSGVQGVGPAALRPARDPNPLQGKPLLKEMGDSGRRGWLVATASPPFIHSVACQSSCSAGHWLRPCPVPSDEKAA